MSLKHIFTLSIIIFGLCSCKTATPITEVSRAEIKEMVTQPETILVDVRTPEEFAESTAKGAINIPIESLKQHLDFFRNNKQAVVFCNKGKKANQAIEILKKKKIKNVYFGKTVQNIKAIQNEKK